MVYSHVLYNNNNNIMINARRINVRDGEVKDRKF